MKQSKLGWLIVLLIVVGCSSPEPEPDPGDPRIVAAYKGGEVTMEDLDKFILSLPPTQRRLPGRDLVDWFEELTRQLAYQHLMQIEADRHQLGADERFLETEAAARRSLLVEICVAENHQLQIDAPTDEEIELEYELRRDQLKRPERRLLYNLFLRFREGESAPQLQARLGALRDRAMGGESFSRLAAEYSDSETRHQEGLMGWIERGMLNPELESIVFGLTEGVPSTPLMTREGGHLYLVDEMMESGELTLDEARNGVRTQIINRRREEAIADWEDSLELPAGSVIPTQKQFFDLLQQGEPDSVVFRVGDHDVTLQTFRSNFEQIRVSERGRRRGRNQNPREMAWRVMKQMERQEVVYAHCVAQGGVDEQALDQRVAQWRGRALPGFATQRRIERWLDQNERRLTDFLEANPGRFSTPPRWQLRRLSIPRVDDSFEVMARLETDVEALDAGTISIDDLAADLGGSIDDLGWRSLPELSAVHPRIPRLVAPLTAGRHTAPFSLERALVILEVSDRKEPASRPFEEIERAVRVQYLTQYREETMAEIVGAALEEAEYRVYPGRLETMREAWRDLDPAKSDEIVNEVIELLEEIEVAEE